MPTRTPKLSIGLPVYNGAKFVRATIDSLLAQTYTDFELIICDNASTDATASIAQEYADRDPRVRVHRNPINVGASKNYEIAVDQARGEYFKWQAADDLVAPTMVQKCIAELDRDETLACVYTRSKRINEKGEIFGEYPIELNLAGPTPSHRLKNWIHVNHRLHHAAELWGVHRTKNLRIFRPLKGKYCSADRVMLSRLMMSGKFKRLEEYLFFDRTHADRSENIIDRSKVRGGSKLARYLGCGPLPAYQWWDPSKAGKIVFPEFRWIYEYGRGIFLIPMSSVERVKCLAVVGALAVKFIPRFGRDIAIAAETLFNRLVERITTHADDRDPAMVHAHR